MSEKEFLQQVCTAVCKIKSTNPLVPSITNSVTINFVANAQLAVGGSAAMVYLPDEGEYLASISKAFYVNMGTLFPVYEESIPRTCHALHNNKCPWVLDPVGIGIGSLRTKLIKQLKEYKPTVLRANASEVIAVAKIWDLMDDCDIAGNVRGVDSTESVSAAVEAAKRIALFTNGAVAVSGETDVVTDGKISVLCHGGSSFMPLITGAGCSLGGVTAVFCSSATPFIAALGATIFYNIAGEKAGSVCSGPGSFQVKFLDALYSITEQDICNSKIEIGK